MNSQSCAKPCAKPCAVPVVCDQPNCQETMEVKCCENCEQVAEWTTEKPTTVHEQVEMAGVVREVVEKPVVYHTKITHPAEIVTQHHESTHLIEGSCVIGERIEGVDLGSAHLVSVCESGPCHKHNKVSCPSCCTQRQAQCQQCTTTTTCASGSCQSGCGCSRVA